MTETCQIRVNHHPHETGEIDLRPPPESRSGLRRIADEVVHFRRPKELGIETNVPLPIQLDVIERDLDQLAHRVTFAGRDDVVVGLSLLQHQPHRANVVAGKTPVATGIEIAERQ